MLTFWKIECWEITFIDKDFLLFSVLADSQRKIGFGDEFEEIFGDLGDTIEAAENFNFGRSTNSIYGNNRIFWKVQWKGFNENT